MWEDAGAAGGTGAGGAGRTGGRGPRGGGGRGESPERLSAQHQRFASRSPRPRHLTKPARVLHDVLELFEVSGQALGRAVSDAIVRHDAQTGARESFKQVRVARGVFADAVQKHDDGARFALGRVLVRA